MPDLTICQDVVDELEFEPRVDASCIGVVVKDGEVTLTGHVRTYFEKLTVFSVVTSMRGVKAVADEIDVRPSERHALSDDEAVRRIACFLDWHAAVPDGSIEVFVKDGHVTLRGTVQWRYQAESAEGAVLHLRGVKGVTNAIQARPRARAPDVQERIRKAFHRDAELNAAAVEIVAEDGVVTLKGCVRNLAEGRAAERAAWAAPGVTKVINCLDIC